MNTLFTLHELPKTDTNGTSVHGRIKVSYAGSDYALLGVDESPFDHSLQSMAMLNELIAIAKISGGLPVSQPVQVLPEPDSIFVLLPKVVLRPVGYLGDLRTSGGFGKRSPTSAYPVATIRRYCSAAQRGVVTGKGGQRDPRFLRLHVSRR